MATQLRTAGLRTPAVCGVARVGTGRGVRRRLTQQIALPLPCLLHYGPIADTAGERKAGVRHGRQEGAPDRHAEHTGYLQASDPGRRPCLAGHAELPMLHWHRQGGALGLRWVGKNGTGNGQGFRAWGYLNSYPAGTRRECCRAEYVFVLACLHRTPCPFCVPVLTT